MKEALAGLTRRPEHSTPEMARNTVFRIRARGRGGWGGEGGAHIHRRWAGSNDMKEALAGLHVDGGSDDSGGVGSVS